MTRAFRILLPITLMLATPAFSAGGATPIWQPTTITESGKYVLTRNVGTFATSSEIVIAASDVDLDLNGFTLAGNIPLRANNVHGVTVHDGSIQAFEQGIVISGVSDLALRRLVVESGDDCAVTLATITRGVVAENRILSHETGALCVDGTAVDIHGNQTSGSAVNLSCTGCRIVGNLASGGIFVMGSGNLIEGNVCRGAPFADGLTVAGSMNQVQDNVLVNNGGFGLRFAGTNDGPPTGNVYRRNTARGNTGLFPGSCPAGNTNFCDPGTGNTSHGDNYMPGQM